MHRLHTLFLVSLLLFPAIAVAESDPWPSFRGPNGTGRLAADLGEGPWTLETRWVRPLGSGYSGIAVGGGLLVTAAQQGEHDFLIALDPENGEERWRYAVEPAYAGHDGSHDGPIATPAIADGRVFMVGTAGSIAAVSLVNGEELWTRHIVEDFGSQEPRYGFVGSPAVAGEVVVLPVGGDEGALVGLDVESGELVWRSLPDSIYGGSPIVANVGGESQILMLSPTYVSGLNPADGRVLWQMAHGDGMAAMGALSQSVLPLDQERLFVKHGEERVSVLGIGPGEGGELEVSPLAESRGLTRSYSPPSLVGNTLYGYTGRILSAIDATTGELLWRSRPPGDGFLVALGDQLAILTKKGTLHLGPASPDGWVESDQVTLFSDLAWTAPSVSGHSIYTRSLGEIARVDLVLDGVADAPPTVEVPAVLQTLAEEVAKAEAGEGADAGDAVTRFLAGRELPWIDGNDVYFLWRGEAEDVTVAGDMIGMRREEVMHRLPGTDLWWWKTSLDQRSRFNYLFFIDGKPSVDPGNWRRTRSSFLGTDMDWQRDVVLDMSWFAMPEWPGWRSAGRGTFDSIVVELPGANEASPATVRRFPVWLPPGYHESPGERYPVVYVHHPQALQAGRWHETLDRVVGRTVEPLLVVFLVEPPGSLFGTMMRGSEHWMASLVPAVDANFRTRTEAEARANVGIGFFAHSAVRATFLQSGDFGRLAVQSYFGIEGEMKEVQATVGEINADELSLRIYLEWGKWDLHSAHEAADVRNSGRWLNTFLRQKGWEVFGGEVADSTDFASWQNRTDLLLETLFPIDGEVPRERLRRWLGEIP